MTYSRNLSQVKQGDLVAVRQEGSYYGKWELKPIIRDTKTQLIIESRIGGESRFNRKSGREIKGGNYQLTMVVPTKELLDEIKKDSLVTEVVDLINKGGLTKLSNKQIAAIKDMLEA